MMKGDDMDELHPALSLPLSPAAHEGLQQPLSFSALPLHLRDPYEMERSELEAYLQSTEYFPTKNDLLEFGRRYNVPINARTQREEIIRLCLRMIHDIPKGFAGLRSLEKKSPTARPTQAKTRETLEILLPGVRSGKHVDNPAVKQALDRLLNTILHCHESSLALAQVGHIDAEHFAQIVEACEIPIETLVRLLTNTLDFSRLSAGTLNLAQVPFSVRDRVGEALKGVALQAHQKRIELLYEVHADVPDTIIGDPTRLQQVIVNLVSNAIKFTERGEIVVRIERGSEVGTGTMTPVVFLRFSVQDTGIGLPKEKQRALAKSLAQTDASSPRKTGGAMGLGLAIAKQLVEMMGGHIWVHSEMRKGSIFYFTTRLQESDVQLNTLLADLALLRDKRILVVDDNATHRRILRELFASWQLSSQLVANAREALALLYRAEATGTPFSVMLIDECLPHMDGFTLIRHMKENVALACCPTVMMLSSIDSKKDAARCLELGVTASLLKPIQPSELLRTLARILGSEEIVAEEEILDRLELASLVEKDAVLLRELISLFWEHCPKRLFELQQAILEKDSCALLSATHALRGEVYSLVAKRALRVLAVLEEIGRQGYFAYASEAFALLVKELLRCKPVLARLERELVAAQPRSSE